MCGDLNEGHWRKGLSQPCLENGQSTGLLRTVLTWDLLPRHFAPTLPLYCCSLLTCLGLSCCFLAFENLVELNTPWNFDNLARRQPPVIASNTTLGVAVRCFIDVVKVHNQLTLSKEDYLKKNSAGLNSVAERPLRAELLEKTFHLWTAASARAEFQSALPDSLSYRFQAYQARLQNHLSQYFAMYLLYIISYWSCSSGWMLTDTVFQILPPIVLVPAAEVGLLCV